MTDLHEHYAGLGVTQLRKRQNKTIESCGSSSIGLLTRIRQVAVERLKSSDNYLHFLLLHELSTFDALEPMRNGFSTAEELRKQNIAYFEDAESRGLTSH